MSEYKKLVVHKLTNDFRAATVLETHDKSELEAKLGPHDILVDLKYWAVNASDVNYTAGKYDPSHKPPMDCGFEALGVVSKIGSNVTKFKVGSAVASMSYGAFSEVQILNENAAIPLKAVDPIFIPLLVCGLTAFLSLKMLGNIKKGETILITAAAGGVGQIAVQLAKIWGLHVIGTCSSQSKVDFLKSIGIDRAINYKTENLSDVLKKEYPKGVNIVVENVGGQTLKDALASIAIKGRLIIVGAVSHYKDETTDGSSPFGPDIIPTGFLLTRSMTASGFFLPQFASEFGSALAEMIKYVEEGKLKPVIDTSNFEGIADIPSAVEYMHQGKNTGKLVVPRRRSDIANDSNFSRL